MFECSKLESLRDVSVNRIGDTLSYGFPQTVKTRYAPLDIPRSLASCSHADSRCPLQKQSTSTTVALTVGEIAYGHSNSMSQFAVTRNTTAKADNGRIPSTSQSGA